MRRDTLLHVAARNNNRGTLQKLLQDEHVNVDSRNEQNQTPLHLAAANGHGLACELLIKAGAHIYVTNDEGMTPLHVSTALAKAECVMVLLKYGSNPYMRDAKGRTAVELVTTAEVADCYLEFFSTVRYNPSLLRRLEKDLMWKEIDDILNQSRGYDDFSYSGDDDHEVASVKSGASSPTPSFACFSSSPPMFQLTAGGQ